MDQAIERIHVPAWAWLLVSVAVFALYAIGSDNGFALQGVAQQAHELFHDGRHFLGVPCH